MNHLIKLAFSGMAAIALLTSFSLSPVRGQRSENRLVKWGNMTFIDGGRPTWGGTWGLYTTSRTNSGYYVKVFNGNGTTYHVYFGNNRLGANHTGSFIGYGRNGQVWCAGRIVLSPQQQDGLYYGRFQVTHYRFQNQWLSGNGPWHAFTFNVTGRSSSNGLLGQRMSTPGRH